ncbi:MAG: aminotransferase class V-fold PLP-dependent enzyme [Chryseosolibacter sp.]
MSPMLKSVEKAGLRGVRLKRNPTHIHPEDFFTITRDLKGEFAKLIHAGNSDRIAIIPSASYGLATVTKNLKIKKGEHVLVAAEQFPSNYYPWQSLCEETGAEIRIVSPEKEFKDRGKIWNAKFIESINAQTKAVAIAHTHWADGTLFDLVALRKRTQEVGALLVIDGTQSVGALPFDVRAIQPDALICAAYKWLLGPYSIGMAYYGEYFNEGKPIEENWIHRLDSENFSGLVNYESRYQPGAARYGMGEHSNFVLAPMALKAVAQINRWGVENIQQYCESITEPAIAVLREKGYLIEELPYRGSHLFGIRHSKGLEPEKLKEKLNKSRIYVSVRGTAIRVSPNVYNDGEDLQRLVKILSTGI